MVVNPQPSTNPPVQPPSVSSGSTARDVGRPGKAVSRSGQDAARPSRRSPGESSPRTETGSGEFLDEVSTSMNRDLRYNVQLSMDVVQAEIVNTKTDEVIKQIPPDEMLELRKKIDEFVGLMIDETG